MEDFKKYGFLSDELALTRNRSRLIVLVDMDGVMCDFDASREKWLAEDFNRNKEDFENVSNLFENLQPMPGAIEAFKRLYEEYDPFLVSTAPWDNPSGYTGKRIWVENYLGNIGKKRLILTHDKSLIKGDILIDDRLKNGVIGFKGYHIRFGSEDYPTWDRTLYAIYEYNQTFRL